MKLKSRPVVSLAALCLLFFVTTGCNMANQTPQAPNQAGTTQLGQNMLGRGTQSTTPETGNNPNRNINLVGTRINQQITSPTGFDTSKADNFKRKLANMTEIQNPNVVVNGNTALVSYKPSAAGANVNNMKNSITNTIKQMDNSITNVVATDSADTGAAINKLANDIKSNKPTNELTDKFNKIMKSITPNT